MANLSLKQKIKPETKQSQKIILSPKMQQGIQLLQSTNLELAALIEAELELNPLLEVMTEEEGLPTDESINENNENQEFELEFDEKDFSLLKKLDEDFQEHFDQNETFRADKLNEENRLKNFIEASIQSKDSLFEFLKKQAHEIFSEEEEELEAALLLIGNLEARGFLTTPLKEISLLSNYEEGFLEEILKKIQNFDPAGVGARSLKESLLIQLKRINQSHSLAYKIIEDSFEDLLKGKFTQIAKSFKKSANEIQNVIKKEISKLDLSPGLSFSRESPQMIIPEIIIEEEDGKLSCRIAKEGKPELNIKRDYLKLAENDALSDEEKRFFKQKIAAARSFLKNLSQRDSTLKRIGDWLIEKQLKFFLAPDGKLEPYTMLDLSKDLNLHESTIARAISHKHLYCDRGILPLRSFFSVTYKDINGKDISSKTIINKIQALIESEDKQKPLSDEILSQKLKEAGIFCARRTIAKYRQALQIGNTKQRKFFK